MSRASVSIGGLVALVAAFVFLHTGARASATCRRERFVPGGDLSLWPPGVRCTYGEPAVSDVVISGWFWLAATAIVIAVGIVGALAIRPGDESARPTAS
jgi:hypothetical protein